MIYLSHVDNLFVICQRIFQHPNNIFQHVVVLNQLHIFLVQQQQPKKSRTLQRTTIKSTNFCKSLTISFIPCFSIFIRFFGFVYIIRLKYSNRIFHHSISPNLQKLRLILSRQRVTPVHVQNDVLLSSVLLFHYAIEFELHNNFVLY